LARGAIWGSEAGEAGDLTGEDGAAAMMGSVWRRLLLLLPPLLPAGCCSASPSGTLLLPFGSLMARPFRLLCRLQVVDTAVNRS